MTTEAFWRRHRVIPVQLLGWATASLVLAAGVAMRDPGPFAAAVALQFAVWGAIDAGIAVAGLRGHAAKVAAGAPASLDAGEAERRRTHRLLWINAGLDVGYLAVAAALATVGDPSAARLGHALGVAVQGGFLLAFDAAHAAGLAAPLRRGERS